MNTELFNRLKKMAKHEGRVVIVEGNDAFILAPLDEYEDSECDCDDECDCKNWDEEIEDFDFGEEEVKTREDGGASEADKELMKKVNEDIAKWRKDQEKNKQEEEKTAEDKKDEERAVESEAKDAGLSEEERYYFEPLE